MVWTPYAKRPGVQMSMIAGGGELPHSWLLEMFAQGGADLGAVTAQRDSYVPRQKQGTPEEIANVAVFLSSDESSFINAADIFVDGGGSGCTYGP